MRESHEEAGEEVGVRESHEEAGEEVGVRESHEEAGEEPVNVGSTRGTNGRGMVDEESGCAQSRRADKEEETCD